MNLIVYIKGSFEINHEIFKYEKCEIFFNSNKIDNKDKFKDFI